MAEIATAYPAQTEQINSRIHKMPQNCFSVLITNKVRFFRASTNLDLCLPARPVIRINSDDVANILNRFFGRRRQSAPGDVFWYLSLTSARFRKSTFEVIRSSSVLSKGAAWVLSVRSEIARR
jgi:hypothetical protein